MTFRRLKNNQTRDYNQKVLMHTDQFGNPVLVQGIAEKPVVCSQVQAQLTQLTEGQLDANSTSQSLEALRANPFIQQLVEERVAILESRMKMNCNKVTTLRTRLTVHHICA